jgi:hypothetical protein
VFGSTAISKLKIKVELSSQPENKCN